MREKVLACIVAVLVWPMGPLLALERNRPTNILFIGNNHTSSSNIHGTLKVMVPSAGMPDPNVAASAPGGVTLQQHTESKETISLIKGGPENVRWDVVVLQEQVELAAMAKNSARVRSSMTNSARKLLRQVMKNNPNASLVLFQTWASHSDAWEKKAQLVAGLGVNSRSMQFAIRDSYERLAESLQQSGAREVRIAKVGDVWEKNYSSARPLMFHASDLSNANLDGSYVAGLVLFSTIYGIGPEQVNFVPLGMSPERQQLLRDFVKKELAATTAQ